MERVFALRDDECTMVQLTACPQSAYWEQEAFITAWFYQTPRPVSWLDTPMWIRRGCSVLAHIEQRKAEEIQRRAAAARGL